MYLTGSKRFLVVNLTVVILVGLLIFSYWFFPGAPAALRNFVPKERYPRIQDFDAAFPQQGVAVGPKGNGPIAKNPGLSLHAHQQHEPVHESRSLLALDPTTVTNPTARPKDLFPVYRHANLTGPRVGCMVFTTPGGWKDKALAVNLTWGSRCDITLYFYSKNPSYTLDGAVALDVPEGRGHLTAKSMTAFKLAYQKLKDEVDWFMKADDDVYIVMENLKALLSQFNPKKPHYLGHRSTDYLKHGYNGGGASYVLSHETARLLVEDGDAVGCKQDGAIEDLDVGDCLQRFKIYPIDTADEKNRLRFHPDHPYKIFADIGDNKRVYTYNKNGKDFGYVGGHRVMSPYTISFHYMDPGHMYMYDFFLYELKRGENPPNMRASLPPQ